VRDLNPQPRSYPTCGTRSWFALKTRLSEVLVERKGGLELHAPHYGKRNAVCEGETFVVVPLESLDPCAEVFRADVQQNDRGAGAQATRDGLRARVIETPADQGERLIEHIGSNNERLRAPLEQPPERDCLLVMLIVRVFQRQNEAGVEQDRRQVSRSYRYSSWRRERSVRPLWPGLEPSSKTGSSAAGMGNTMMRPGSCTISTCFAPLSKRLGINTPSFFTITFMARPSRSQDDYCTPVRPIGGGRRLLVLDRRPLLSYKLWREANPEDALRLHEVGMIKSSPEKIIAQGTDWRFLNELKKELKA
jgi:hypothetical protein